MYLEAVQQGLVSECSVEATSQLPGVELRNRVRFLSFASAVSSLVYWNQASPCAVKPSRAAGEARAAWTTAPPPRGNHSLVLLLFSRPPLAHASARAGGWGVCAQWGCTLQHSSRSGRNTSSLLRETQRTRPRRRRSDSRTVPRAANPQAVPAHAPPVYRTPPVWRVRKTAPRPDAERTRALTCSCSHPPPRGGRASLGF